MTSDEKIERELLARLSRLLDDEGMPKDVKDLQVEMARDALRAFYRPRGLYAGEEFYRFDDESKSLVPFEPAPSLRVKQDGWEYRG